MDPDQAGPILPEVFNAGGSGAVVLVCEHASNAIPARYANLGLDDGDLTSHVAWDPGAYDVARAVAGQLDAIFVASRVSRLVYDCNRLPESPDAMPEISEIFEIPGNKELSDAQKRERVENVYLPFKQTLSDVISRAGQLKIMVTVHSFTPVYFGASRDVHIGILHDEDSRFADAMLELSGQFTSLDVRRNEPYGPEDGVTHTLIEHGVRNGLMNVMIEIRNDLLAVEQDRIIISDMLAAWIGAVCDKLGIAGAGKGTACPE